jgi:hypothetical protein
MKIAKCVKIKREREIDDLRKERCAEMDVKGRNPKSRMLNEMI